MIVKLLLLGEVEVKRRDVHAQLAQLLWVGREISAVCKAASAIPGAACTAAPLACGTGGTAWSALAVASA